MAGSAARHRFRPGNFQGDARPPLPAVQPFTQTPATVPQTESPPRESLSGPTEPDSAHKLTVETELLSKAAWIGAGVAALMLIVLLVYRLNGRHAGGAIPTATAKAASGPANQQGTAIINSHPDGAVVVVDGTTRGVTPLTLTLSAGAHTLEIQNGLDSRKLPLTIDPSVVSSQYIELPADADPDPKVVATALAIGGLEITSEPAGATVAIDGRPRGATPLVLKSIKAGRHDISVTEGQTTRHRLVTVAPGARAVVDMSLAPTAAASAAGWVALNLPFETRLIEDGRVVGTTSGESVMLLAGRHNLELANDALEFHVPLSVDVAAGKTVPAPVTVPNGSLSINALPWAQVSVDGRPLGTTPLANVPIAIGRHEVVFRHPQLGERRQTVVVTARTPVRIGMDLSK